MPPLPSSACALEAWQQFQVMPNAMHYVATENQSSVFNRLQPIHDRLWGKMELHNPSSKKQLCVTNATDSSKTDGYITASHDSTL